MNENKWLIVIYALRLADALLRLVETVLKRTEKKGSPATKTSNK